MRKLPAVPSEANPQTQREYLVQLVRRLEQELGRAVMANPEDGVVYLGADQPVDIAADAEVGEWVFPTLVNGWENYGGNWADVRYRILPGNVMQCVGLVKNGTANHIFTIEGYRPIEDYILTVFTNDDAKRLDIKTNGQVIRGALNNATAWVSLCFNIPVVPV